MRDGGPSRGQSVDRGDVPDPVRSGDALRASRQRMFDFFQWAVSVLAGMAIVVFVVFAFFLDMAFGVGAWFDLRMTGFAVLFALPAALLVVAGGRRWQRWALAGAVLLVLVIWAVPWHPRKSFLRDFDRIENGMTLDEVEATMSRWGYGYDDEYDEPPDDWPRGAARATFTGNLGYRWTREGIADWGSVRFVNGRVVDTHWSPD